MLSLGATPTASAAQVVQVSPEVHARAVDYVDRLVKIVRGGTPLPYFQRRQLRPIQVRVAARLAANQVPFFTQADLMAVHQIASR